MGSQRRQITTNWDYSAIVLLSFAQSKFINLSREENQMADALATLASTWEIGKQAEMKPLILMRSQAPCFEEIRIMPVDPMEKPWFYDLQHYLETGQFPKDAERKERMSLRILSHQFISHNEILYKRAPAGVHLRYIDKDEAQKLMKTIHDGVCRPHMNGTVLAKKIAHQGYFWLTMETDCVKFVNKCHNC